VVAGEAFLVVSAVEEHALFVAVAEVLELLLDLLAVGVVARGLAGEVGVEAGAVPVALDGLGADVDFDVEVLGAALHDLAHEPELVSHVDADAGPDLDFVLAAHHFAVGAGDVEAGHQALEKQRVREQTPEAVFAAHRAVLRALRLRLAVLREAERPRLGAVQRHDAVLLLDSEPRDLLGACVEDLLGVVPEVSAARLGHVEVGVGLAEDDDVWRAAERIRDVLDGLEEDLGVVAGGLFGGRAVEVPRSRQLVDAGDAGAVVDGLGLAAQLEFAAQPDLLRKHYVFQFVFRLLEVTH